MILRISVCLGVWAAVSTPAFGATADIAVREALLNRFVQKLEPIQGSSPNRIGPLNEKVHYQLKSPRFVIRATGVVFQSQFSGSYAGFSVPIFGGVDSFEAPVQVSYDSASSELRLSIPKVNVPISVSLPLIGLVNLTGVGIDPQASFAFPIAPFTLQVRRADGAYVGIHARTARVSFRYEPGIIHLKPEMRVWR